MSIRRKTAPLTNRKAPRACKLKIVIHEADEGGYWAEVPGFPGCVSEGESLAEVRANVREAFEGVLEVMQDVPTDEPGRTEVIDL
jgi:predicted RNase H-like HicB family nuclease